MALVTQSFTPPCEAPLQSTITKAYSDVDWGCDAIGQDISTTEFERIGGRASSKKWKQSVRVISDHGTVGKLIGDWLMVHPPAS